MSIYTHTLIYVPSPWTSLPCPTTSPAPRSSWSAVLSSLRHTANSHWLSVLRVIMFMFQCYSFKLSQPLLSLLLSQVCSLCLCLLCCPENRFISTIFLDSIYIYIYKNMTKHAPASEGEPLLVAKSCLMLCDPMECSPPGSSVHGIFQARILEWVATSFSRRSSPPRDRIQVSCITGRLFTAWTR